MVVSGEKCQFRSRSALVSFGGSWTHRKLEILRLYLDAYTTVLKNQRFRLIYVDAFAGEGVWHPGVESAYSTEDYGEFYQVHEGSSVTAEPSEVMSKQLDRIFGERRFWHERVYHPPLQKNMFDDAPGNVRTRGSKQIAACYRKRLEDTFEMIAPTPRTFYNSKQSPLFELYFAASNPTGAPKAVGIADHILKNW